MKIPFWKMHGAGNDFILVDDRSETFPLADGPWIESICMRRRGVGAEGVILIQPSSRADFRMRFLNPDGSEVEMCGNGARCVARLASEIGAAPSRMTIDTVAGELTAEASGNEVRLWMTPPRDWRGEQILDLGIEQVRYSFVNTGVPHAVVEIAELDACKVDAFGAAIRYHADFAPAGTNANFISATGPRELRVRTYERGVEAETLACGTGMVASALVAARLGRVSPPVRVLPRSGDAVTVDFTLTDEGAENVTLTGPALHVFQGTLHYSPAPCA